MDSSLLEILQLTLSIGAMLLVLVLLALAAFALWSYCELLHAKKRLVLAQRWSLIHSGQIQSSPLPTGVIEGVTKHYESLGFDLKG